MREGWEYKKLGEVCKVTMGQSPDGTSINDKEGMEFHQGKTCFGERYLKASPLFSNAPIRIAEANSVLLCVRAPVGYPNITEKTVCIGRGLCSLVVRENINHKFLYYTLLGKQSYFEKNATGSTFKAISSKVVVNTPISLPPKSVQLEIVSELDQINELIRLKKEQLKDYDNLAQSIFYAMFGDPVENDKGWEVTRFSEVFNVTSSKRIYLQELVNEGVPFLKVSDIVSMVDGKEAVPKSFIKESLFDDLQSRGLVPRKGDLLITARGTLGKCYIMKETDRFYFQDGMVTWLQKKVELESLFVKYVFCDNSFRVYLNRNAKHTTVDYISIQHLGNMKIPLPPLPLQQEFSSRISQIERQKAEVSNAIADLETLLASRMQYWFE